MLLDRKRLLQDVIALARLAGDEIMRIYRTDFEATLKADDSPVTEADLAAERVILPGLEELTPSIPIVSEEAVSQGTRPNVGLGPFWLVDPLDGTREFLARNGEFTVNIALVENRLPVLGVVYAPAVDVLYSGAVGLGANRQVNAFAPEPISVRAAPAEGLTVLASRRHGDPQTLSRFLAGRKMAALRNAGSSLKFCLIAAGEGDMYPRFGETYEWDTAAGHAVLAAAGGRVTLTDGATPLAYAKQGLLNPHFIAWGGVN